LWPLLRKTTSLPIPMKKSSFNRKDFKVDGGYRSGLEEEIAKQLEAKRVQYEYEKERITYHRTCYYLPDFKLPNGIFIEAKGRFTKEDRGMLLKVKKQHPDLDIRLVFSRSKARISKESSTTYAQWCERWGFPYADKQIPEEWLSE
jgi:hypothetical protein